MAYNTWTDDKGNTFSAPYIPDKIVGFHGIDPDLVGGGSGGGSSSGIDDHEQLQNLLGGDARGHYHVTDLQYEWLCMLLNDMHYAHHLSSQNGLEALIDARIAKYLTDNNIGG